MSLGIVILAAGQGTRMRSERPKVLHELAGAPLLEHVINTCRALAPEQICIVVGHGSDLVRDAIRGDYDWVLQSQQLGTGHALQQAMPHLNTERILVVYGDVPLLRADTLRPLLETLKPGDLALLTVDLTDPRGYGRIVRDPTGRVRGIVEEKDASPEIKEITEGNTGVMCAHRADFARWLSRLDNNNAQGEYYLTDCVAHCVADDGQILAIKAASELEVSGVNTKKHLEALERAYQLSQADALLEQAVGLADRHRIDIRGRVTTGRDVFIDINCVLVGEVQLGDGVRIGPNCVIKDSRLGDGVEVLPNTLIETSVIGNDCTVGPFARIRPGTELAQGVKVGNFVEIKKSQVGIGSKVNHLSYIGDATIGAGVNVGAGTITCNYDGANKHRTVIEDAVFVGSNTALVAPVRVGQGATIGAGSVVTKDAPASKLTVARGRQTTIEHWERPVKRKS
ncbi:MAG: bifunctional UDP-N-acetylglucosamine diphosphorylase/glucosamine-1-phosphate N-acetyltransferase GlmU [Thiotrichales bacterium]